MYGIKDLKAAEGSLRPGERSEPERRDPSKKTAGLRSAKQAQRPDPDGENVRPRTEP